MIGSVQAPKLIPQVVERQGKEVESLRTREKAATDESKKATKQWREVERIYKWQQSIFRSSCNLRLLLS